MKKSALLAGATRGLPFTERELTAQDREAEFAVVEGKNPAAQVRAAVNLVGGIRKFVLRGERVVVLPNPQGRGPGVTTHPGMVSEIIRLCLEAGAPSVTVATVHGPGRWDGTGIVEKVQEAGGRMKYPDPDSWVTVPVLNGWARRSVTLLRDALETDVLINMPIFKHHVATRITGCLKNLMGVNSDSASFHQGDTYLHQAIVDLASTLSPRLCIVDATTILAERGPFGPGRVFHPRKVYAGKDMVALDALCCGLLKVNPQEVLHIQLAQESGLGQKDLDGRKMGQIRL